MGFEITEAEDGEKALEVCKRAMPDAVLLEEVGLIEVTEPTPV
jgi:hypothetical protein